MVQQSNLDRKLDELKKFEPLLRINDFFKLVDKMEQVDVVPFYIGCKKLNFNCQHLFQNKKNQDLIYYYCNQADVIAQFVQTSSTLITCEGCEYAISR